jgi:hypothetical protein
MPADLAFTLTLAYLPAPPTVMDAIQEIEVECSTELASAFRLRLGLSRNLIGDYSILFEDLFRPLLPVSIRLSGPLGVPEALINGYVSHQQVTYGDEPGAAVLEVTGMDVTMVMNLEEKVRSWPNLPDAAVAAAIFGEHAVVPRVQPTLPQLVEPEATRIQRGSDIRFLRLLAERNGFECYVQPEPLSGLDMGYFQPPQLLPGPAQAVLNVNMGPDTNVAGFKVDYDMLRPTMAFGAGIDARTKAIQPAIAPISTLLPLGLEGSLLRILPPPQARPADTGLFSTGELQTAAQALVDRSSWAVSAEGSVGPSVGILRPGGLVNVRGAGRVHSGAYYVTKVWHVINRDGHSQRFQARRNAVGLTGAELFVDVA